MNMNMKRLKLFFLTVDLGFCVYWVLAWLHVFPRNYVFKDYDNPILDAWNFSFLPLDLLVSATGFSSIWCYFRQRPVWQPLAIVSLTLTFCSGLQAIAFWALRRDFDVIWWAPNSFLMIYPLFFIVPMLGDALRRGQPGYGRTERPARPPGGADPGITR